MFERPKIKIRTDFIKDMCANYGLTIVSQAWKAPESTSSAARTSGFYRFASNTRGVLANGGTLQMLAVQGVINYDAWTG